MAGEKEEVKRNLDETGSALGSQPKVPAWAGDSKSSDEARAMAARLAGVTAGFDGDAKLCKEIEVHPYFIKKEDKKGAVDFKKAMFIESQLVGGEVYYSLQFPFVLSSHPSTYPIPLCKQELIQQKITSDDAIKIDDHILMSATGVLFKPHNGYIALYYLKEINGKLEMVCDTKAPPFFQLNEFIETIRKETTRAATLLCYAQSVGGLHLLVSELFLVKDIADSVDAQIKRLQDSHRKEPKASPPPEEPPQATGQVPIRRYGRRSTARHH